MAEKLKGEKKLKSEYEELFPSNQTAVICVRIHLRTGRLDGVREDGGANDETYPFFCTAIR